MRRLGKIDCLVNLAGTTPATPQTNLAANTGLALASLEEAARLGIARVFLASSAAVYGVPAEDTPLSEDMALDPASPYGQAKHQMELAVGDWQAARTGQTPGITCLRIGNLAGADQLLLNAVRATAATPLILDRFPGGASPLRPYIGPETLARVVVSLALTAAPRLPPVLNVAAPQPVFMADLLAAMAAGGNPVACRNTPAANTSIASVRLDISALGRFHRFRRSDSEAVEMIRQWQRCRATP